MEFTTPNSIADEVWKYLRRQLLVGTEYPPGSFIREVDVAEKLHISRSPVREAIKELETHGLVKSVPRKGAMVVSFSRQDIDELYNVRLSLEMLVYRHIVENDLLKEENYHWLLNCVDGFKTIATPEKKDTAEGRIEFFETDCQFHFYIHNLSKMYWTTELLRKTYSRLYLVQLKHISLGGIDTLIMHHRQLAEELHAGNLDKLKELSVLSYRNGRYYYFGQNEAPLPEQAEQSTPQ